MVTCRFYGRLGNSLFQAAAAIGYAIKHDLEYHIPTTTVNPSVWPPNIFHLTHPKYDDRVFKKILMERTHAYEELPFQEDWRDKNIVIDGYRQSEKYFEHCPELIKDCLLLKPREKRERWVSVHVRRGDYLTLQDKHPVVSEAYLERSIEHFFDKGYTQFHVFSDDVAWCKEFFGKLQPYYFTFEYSDPKATPKQDMLDMAACEHHIIANSSFSWWGAWAGWNPDKIVIAPKVWFGPGNKNLNTEDICPESWIRI